MTTAYLAPTGPTVPDICFAAVKSVSPTKPDRSPTGARQDLTMLDSPDRPDSQGSSMCWHLSIEHILGALELVAFLYFMRHIKSVSQVFIHIPLYRHNESPC
jgi:hypothetical protein